MNIVIITGAYHPYLNNGVATYLIDMADRLARDKEIERIDIITYRYDLFVSKEECFGNKVFVYRADYNKDFLLNEEDLNRIKKRLKNIPYPVFHIHSRELYKWIELFGIENYVLTVHNCSFNDFQVSDELNKSVFNVEKMVEKITEKDRLDIHKLEKNTYKKARVLIAISSYIRNLLVRYYGISEKKVVLIHNSLNIQKLRELEKRFIDRESFRNRFADHEEKILLFSGRVVIQKGISYILKMFNELSVKKTKMRLVVAGRAEAWPIFYKNYKFYKMLTITGQLTLDDIYRLYMVSDVGIVPSIIEPFGYVSIEMQYFRLPTLISKVDGLTDTFIENKTALGLNVRQANYSQNVFSPREMDVREMVQKTIRLCSNTSLIAKLKINSRPFVEDKFGIENHVKALKEVYRKNC